MGRHLIEFGRGVDDPEVGVGRHAKVVGHVAVLVTSSVFCHIILLVTI